MGFLDLFFIRTPEKCEQKADDFFDSGSYGPAKVEYETALDKLERKNEDKPEMKQRLEKKIIRSKEALARQHCSTGDELTDTGNYKDAEDLFRLALELTSDTELIQDIEKKLEKIQEYSESEDFSDDDLYQDDDSEYNEDGDEYFTALCSALPEEERKAYLSYGETFQQGYIALNQGDFEEAGEFLSKAMDENSSPGSFIPLELATACMNLGDFKKAHSLLEDFLEYHPEVLRAYGLLCEILWEKGEMDKAFEILSSCPEENSDSAFIYLLRGETLFRSKRFHEAEALFLEYIKNHGWEENIARSLAETYEALDLKEKARDLYAQIMNACQSCRRKPDPFIKQRYADISFEKGDHSTKILEIYLSLAREDNEKQGEYYKKISRIYALQGNEKESMRFQSFAEKFDRESID